MSVAEDPIVKSASRWFWWIAGLSLVNTVMLHSGSNTNFVMGLAMTTVVGLAFAQAIGVGIAITAVILGFYVAMGVYAQRGKLWAFYAGLAVYAVDALICASFEDWMSAGFHALAIFFIARGVTRIRELERMPTAEGA